MLTTLACNESFGAKNPLLGSWKSDNAKTLHEFSLSTKGSKQLKSDAAKAKRFIESAAKKLGSNTTLTYIEGDCIEIADGLGRLFLEGNNFYVEVKVDDYTYRDYFTKFSGLTRPLLVLTTPLDARNLKQAWTHTREWTSQPC